MKASFLDTLGKGCIIPSLEGLWMYGVRVYTAVTCCDTVTNLDTTGTMLRNASAYCQF